MYDYEQLFYVDKESLVIRIPHITQLDLFQNRVVVVEVSINDGVDWTQDIMDYTFRPTPQMTSLSHYFTNLRADFSLTIFGYQFEDNVDKCTFGKRLTSKGKF